MIEEQAKGKTAQEKVEKFTVRHKCGLHLRPAGLFVKIAQKYQADITVEKDGEVVDGKSIIALTTLIVSYIYRILPLISSNFDFGGGFSIQRDYQITDHKS